MIDCHVSEYDRIAIRRARFERRMVQSPQLSAFVHHMMNQFRREYAPWFSVQERRYISRRWLNLMALDLRSSLNRSVLNLLLRGPFLRRPDAGEILAALREQAFTGHNSMFRAVMFVLYREKRADFAKFASLRTLRKDIEVMLLVQHLISTQLNSQLQTTSRNLFVSRRRVNILLQKFNRAKNDLEAKYSAEKPELEPDETAATREPGFLDEIAAEQELADNDDADLEHFAFYLDNPVAYEMYEREDALKARAELQATIDSWKNQIRVFRQSLELLPAPGTREMTEIGRKLESSFYLLESRSTNPYALRLSWSILRPEPDMDKEQPNPLLRSEPPIATWSEIRQKTEPNAQLWEIYPGLLYLAVPLDATRVLETLYFDHELVNSINGEVVPYDPEKPLYMFVRSVGQCLARGLQLDDFKAPRWIDTRHEQINPIDEAKPFTKVLLDVSDAVGDFGIYLFIAKDT